MGGAADRAQQATGLGSLFFFLLFFLSGEGGGRGRGEGAEGEGGGGGGEVQLSFGSSGRSSNPSHRCGRRRRALELIRSRVDSRFRVLNYGVFI